mmetsp:Transcript_57921/g.129137  ORF Transcript_57921/g.129137 Transcript_57921/m.129137 type:complete len:256 (-) Transcript_57921:1317-2084(-)
MILVSSEYFMAVMYAEAVSSDFFFSVAFASEPIQRKMEVNVSSRKMSSSSRSACAKSKICSILKVPVSLEQWKSWGSLSTSSCTLSLGYSPLPPTADQNSSGSLPSRTAVVVRVNLSVSAIMLATSSSASLAPLPCQTNMLPGVSSTKQSPELSDAATSSTCTARVSSAELPLIWKKETPSVSYESPSDLLAKPDALPPERMTILPLNSLTKWEGSLPITTRTCVAAPPTSSSMRVAMRADAPFSSAEDWDPCQK